MSDKLQFVVILASSLLVGKSDKLKSLLQKSNVVVNVSTITR